MKRLTLFLSALLFGQLLALAEAQIGKPAQDFTATDINVKTHQLSNYKGRIVVLESYNLECPFCANHFKTGAMQELQAYAAAKDVVWLLVNSASRHSGSYRNPAAARKEFAAQKMKAAAWLDDNSGAIGKAYGLKTTPHMVVIDKNGVVACDPRKARNYVREAIDNLNAGKPVSVAKTKSYGCAVKYAD